MSVATWKDEFMPTPAYLVNTENAIDHVLIKWVGLREENLKMHGLIQVGATIMQTGLHWDSLDIDDKSCALCVLYFDNSGVGCTLCPLYEALGGLSCCRWGADVWERYGLPTSPYDMFVEHGDPEPMITSLLLVKYGITMREVLK